MIKIHFDIKKSAIFVLISLLSITGTSTAYADNLVVSGNGSDSTSQVNSDTNTTVTVAQDNNTSIDNSVQTTSTTGGNAASDNTGGDTSINTGDTQTDVTITNTANSSSTTVDCCPGSSGGDATITGNGSGSDNAVTVAASNTSTVAVSNNASITTNIYGIANTGNNTANNNTSGNTSINTGNISVSEQIKNGPLNIGTVSTTAGGIGTFDVKISGNGSFSRNTAELDLDNTHTIVVANAVDILNNSVWLLNTGNNHANGNTGGDVTIGTGDISFLADILNGPINVNTVEVTCCEEEEEKSQPTGGVETPRTPVNQTSNNDSKPSETKSSGNGKGGEVLAAAMSKILPATGNYTMVLFLIGNVAMLLLGVILRLRSGNSPGVVK